MIDTMQELTEQYTAALEDYLAGAKEEALQRAYELGRKAIADGVGVLDLASIHNRSLAAVLTNSLSRSDAQRVAGQAATFFAESLSPFEMVLRGYREANTRLRANLLQLETAERELQWQNKELASAQQVVDAERRRYQELFHFAPGGYLVTDLDGNIQEANIPAANLLAMDKDSLAGKALSSFIRESERQNFCDQLSKLGSGEAETFKDWQVTLSGQTVQELPVSLLVEAVRNPQGNRVALRWLMNDISERRRIEEERAQLRIREHIAHAETVAAQWLKFLADASETLAASLDYETIVASIARLSVSYLADCCIVHLSGDPASIQHVAVVHSDPNEAEKANRLQHCLSQQAKIPEAMAEILATNKSELVPEISEAWLQSIAGGTECLEILREFRLKSALLVPLFAQGRPLGTITLARSEDKPAYRSKDKELAEEFARRSSLVLDNAKLHSEVIIERDKAGSASKAKDEFVAILSHELRTPLTIILGWARILKKQTAIQAEPMLNQGAQVLEHNARHVVRLVEDCLDIARITERKIHLRKELLDLNEVVKTTLEATREATSEKDLHFLVHLSPTAQWVFGDRTRLEQVVSNLLSNASRYTDKGGLVSVTALTVGLEAEISIQDTGIGIEPDFLEQIFQPFRQGTHQWLASESGLGLGLAIAQQIVQMHGGRIWAESQGPGFGSTFRIRLPLVAGQSPNIYQPAPPIQVSDGKKVLRILFVEDSADVLELMRIELEAIGFSVLTVMDGISGLEVAKREHPDVIVSDIKMPRMDGYEFIKQLRQIPELTSTPAIALTGFGMNQDIEKALAAGYNAHLFKPVEIEHLAGLIHSLVTPEGTLFPT